MQPRTDKKRRRDYMSTFSLEGDPLVTPDRKLGTAGLQAAIDDQGEPVLIKYWLRQTSANDSELREIWTHEIRQLHRLAGYPGAAEVIADLVRSDADSRGYYLVFNPGSRRPLETLLARAHAGHWLKQPRVARHRARLWRNLKRIATGLELLHAQGLLHRNLDAWSVLTGSDDDEDFQLTGFEWSMRIVSAAGSGRGKRPHKAAIFDSFDRDWAMFGGLTARLCGADVTRLADKSIGPSDVSTHLNPDEIRFLRSLLDIDPFARIDGETINRSIDEILDTLSAEIAGREPKLHVVFSLGERSKLSDAIRRASGGLVDAKNVSGQLDWIADDLTDGPVLFGIRGHDDPTHIRLVIQGRNLLYRLRPFAPPKDRENPTWDFAFCDMVDAKPPTTAALIRSLPLAEDGIEIMPTAEAGERLGRLRGKLTSWSGLLREFQAEAVETPPEEAFRLGLVLTQFLEVLQGACDIFPVEIEAVAPDQSGETRFAVKLRKDPDRDELCKIFGWKSQASRLRDRLFGRAPVENGLWQLSDSAQVGDKGTDASECRYAGELDTDDGEVFLFRGQSTILREGYLTPGASVGRDAVFRRRLKALGALKEHRELLLMLTDPRQRVLDSQDALSEDDAFNLLDEPKQKALAEIVGTLPFYLVQGPPGVGKTRLVSELVRRRFTDDPTSRILLTAQSNAAVDHLMTEVTPALAAAKGEQPLVIRCTRRETRERPHPLEIRPQSSQLLSDLAASPLAQDAPPRLQQRLRSLASAGDAARPKGRQAGWSADTDRRAFESIVMRAANIVFATTNSGELEKLIDEKGQCDWAIVEEAGKATGGELVSPSLLSHRRLMIGDHLQLPPFGSEQMQKLLQSPSEVRKALKLGRGLVGRALRGADTDEDLDEIDDADFDLAALCGHATRSYLLFQTLFEAEVAHQDRAPGRGIARRLSAQHRMHPRIADLVSTGFYKDLTTHPSAEERFGRERSPFRHRDNSFPDLPIVVVDMPYVQVGGSAGEETPQFHNSAERAVIARILDGLDAEPGSRAPTLAVLAPYREQVTRLQDALDGRLVSQLVSRGFVSPQKDGRFTGTVDSFQGNEADIVLVSLVRNNAHTHPRTALGFLTEKRRMNVLLSRARWQLVLVTSLAFLDAVLAAPQRDKDAVDLDHLQRVRDYLDDGINQGFIARVDGGQSRGQS